MLKACPISGFVTFPIDAAHRIVLTGVVWDFSVLYPPFQLIFIRALSMFVGYLL